MYSSAVERTQIYLSKDALGLLDREAARTGASRSELIRRAVLKQYGSTDADSRRKALIDSAGLWADRDFSGKEYVDVIRGDLNKRLSRLGL